MGTTPPADHQPDPAQPLPAKFRDSLDATVNEPVPWIIENLISEGEQMLIFGAPKVGKSHFALQMAMAVALGKPFHHWPVGGGQNRRVLYVNLEIGERSFMRRIAGHYLAATREDQNLDDQSPVGSEQLELIDESPISLVLLEQINKGIKGWLFYSDGIRSLGINRSHLETTTAPTEKPSKEDALVQEWHRIMDAIQPDLIVFDTLSKMHSIDERENSAIQGVLMLIRRIATIRPESNGGPRREIAHVIVHHARKSSENSQQSYNLSLDSIRGGSAIRAEADVIIGIGGQGSPTPSQPVVRRTITIEARSRFGESTSCTFNGLNFSLGKGGEEATPSNDLVEKTKRIFMKLGARGIANGELVQLLSGHTNHGSSEYRRHAQFLKNYVARKKDSELELLVKKADGHRTKGFPVQPPASNAAALYWIRDGSPWLEEDSIKKAIADFQNGLQIKPAPVSNGSDRLDVPPRASRSRKSRGASQTKE